MREDEQVNAVSMSLGSRSMNNCIECVHSFSFDYANDRYHVCGLRKMFIMKSMPNARLLPFSWTADCDRWEGE